jgi:hypothetical protein
MKGALCKARVLRRRIITAYNRALHSGLLLSTASAKRAV